ncbi:MAG: response regulator, partial [Gammaproteobacteria bacterium]
LDDFSGLKIGSIEGYAVTEIIKNNYPKLIIVPVSNTEEGLQKVSDGDIDGYIGAFHILALAMESRNFSSLELTAIQDISLDFSFAVRKGLEPLVVILNKLISGMSEKQKKAITNNWVKLSLEQGLSLSEVLKWLLPILSLIFTFTIFVIYYNRKLAREIQRRKTIESELIRATNEAESANEAKSEFLANMSHEIRTPMNAVLGMCQVLKDSELSSEQKKNLQVIHASTDTLLMLVNDILDISKIESGKIDLESRIFELKTVLDHLEAQINLLINKHRVSFTISVDENVPDLLKGDSLRLGQILLNICNNAAKFTLQGSIDLKISVVEQGDESIILKFIVTDTGIGMDQKQISKIFKTYSQADSSISRIYGGTGLGLMITKHLVELMDGHIWVDSVYGEGSSFGFQITQTAVSESSASEYMQRHNVDSVNASQSYVTKLQDKRVLVVDDNRVNLMVAAKLLTMVGVEVDQAENGQTALNLCQTNRYDAVLMDLQMPVMDGYTATIQIKKQRENSSLPIIALSANVMQADIDKCYAVGMSDHIPKPLSMEKLYGTLASYIN